MKYLILVKHSLPEIVKELPARDWILSEEGRRRAQVLAEKLRPYQPEMMISSIEPKAIQTAEIIASALDRNVQVMENLHEHERSHIPFLSQEVFESNVRKLFDQPDELVFGQETANQSHDRFRNAVSSVLNKHPNRTIVIVAHGTVISLFVARLTKLAEFALWKELGLPSYIVVDMQSNAIVAEENIS